MIRITNIKIIKDLSDIEIFESVIAKYKIPKNQVIDWYISRKSIDARRKDDVHYSYSIDINLINEDNLLKYKNIIKISENKLPIFHPKIEKTTQPVIVGAGPAGLFATLSFIENGYKPIVIEQGSNVDERKKIVDNFINNGVLNPFSNIQFGEGGAGTFSDGKLTTGINSPYIQSVLKEFVRFGEIGRAHV